MRDMQKSCQVSESLIKLITQREPHLRSDSQLFEILCREIGLLVEFMCTYFNDQIFEKLSSKVNIV